MRMRRGTGSGQQPIVAAHCQFPSPRRLLMPRAYRGLRSGLHGWRRAPCGDAHEASRGAAYQRLAGEPEPFERYRGAAGGFATAFHVAFVGVALGGIAPHAVADPARLRPQHQLLMRLDQTRMLGPADLVRKGDGTTPVIGLWLTVDVGKDHAGRSAGGGDFVRQAGDRPDEWTSQRACDDQERVGQVRVTPLTEAVEVLTNELLEFVLLVLVPSDADKKRGPQAHWVLSGAGCEGSDKGALISSSKY